MAERDFYDVLGVGRDADGDAIKKAYRRLAMKYHPDRNAGDKDAEARFKEVQQAYAVLSDEQKRAAYNRFGRAGVFGGGGGGDGGGGRGGFQGADFSDFFDDIFSDIFGGGGRRADVRRRGRDVQLVLDITLEDAAAGAVRKVRVPGNTACASCDGSGAAPGSRPTECATCRGAGRVRMRRGGFVVQQTCPACRGDGRAPGTACSACGGRGRVAKAKTLSVKIPPGIDEGEAIRLSGEGELGDAGPGDLYIRMRVLPHDLFRRKGDDLHLEMPIGILTAALGGEIVIPTLAGSTRMKVPAETQSGKIFRLRGKGIKGLHSGASGDLLCRVTVETPIKLNDEQKDLLLQFGESLKRSSRSHTPRGKSWFDKMRAFLGD
jgi:molecular chaperone DnaJ